MTNKKYFELWAEFKANIYGCRPDENGNYPCDNGSICEACQTDKACELFKQWRENRTLKNKKHRITVTDTATYEFDINYTREEAVKQAIEWFSERQPCIKVEELK